MQEIICVLDKSGSMQSVADDATGGFNQFLKDQQAIGEANITVAWFHDGWEIGYQGNLADCKPLNGWPCGGMTALYDGIGKTIDAVSERFAREKPEKVILAILTDGHENASKEFTKDGVAAVIKEHQDKYGWHVVFLAADQDAWAVAQGLNIPQANAVNYASYNTRGGFNSYSTTVASLRNS